jgi:hypothetical protein
MRDPIIGVLRSAGVDISTGHAADSFLSPKGEKDPWASNCISLFIDTVINHEKIYFPLPSKSAIENLDDDLLPLVFVKSREYGFLEPKVDVSADQVILATKQPIWPSGCDFIVYPPE